MNGIAGSLTTQDFKWTANCAWNYATIMANYYEILLVPTDIDNELLEQRYQQIQDSEGQWPVADQPGTSWLL